MDPRRPETPDDLIDLSRTVDRALATHHRLEAVEAAEQLLDQLFDHHRSLRQFRDRADRVTAEIVETAMVGMIAEVALTIGELIDGGRWPHALLRAHVAELIDLEVDCGVLSLADPAPDTPRRGP